MSDADERVKFSAYSDVHDPLALVPPEIAGAILEYAADPFPENTVDGSDNYDPLEDQLDSPRMIRRMMETDSLPASYPLKLAAVCRRWREIAFADPKLWDIVVMRRTAEKWTLSHELVEQWLARSGGRPLTVVLSWNLDYQGLLQPISSSLCGVDILSIINTICAHSHHWRNLVIQLPPSLIPYFWCSTEATRDLDFFLIDSNVGARAELQKFDPGYTLIRPKHATLLGAPRLDSFSWASLKRLDIVGTSAFNLLHTFEQTPQLEEFTGMIYGQSDEATAFALMPVTLPKLVKLGVTIKEAEGNILFRKLIAPALRSLSFASLASHGGILTWIPVDAVTAFVLESDMRLRYLSIKDCGLHESDMIPLLSVLTDLRELNLSDTTDVNHADVDGVEAILLGDAFLDCLVSSLSPDLPVKFLPKLSAFSYEGPKQFSWRAWADVFHAHCRRDLNNPHKRPLEHIAIHVSPEIHPESPGFNNEACVIDRETLTRFCELPVDWLRVDLDWQLLDYSFEYHNFNPEVEMDLLFCNYHTNPELLDMFAK
ncbi:hypothetical protein D9619_002570 [Psilocybe cf. subviscida]|uniref:F-box domain-containing protein n=1 Tax=Psilocybe cf. subviscida TaxID=2480587 RepID=A0A8H5AWU2_9AGAR|nr:hypothetical protein D9619_002570 [Psilocybe cf. subviscida]